MKEWKKAGAHSKCGGTRYHWSSQKWESLMCVRASCRGWGQLAQFWQGMHPVSLCPSSCRRTQAGPQRSQSHQTRAQFWMATSLSPPREREMGMESSKAGLNGQSEPRLSHLSCWWVSGSVPGP